nr:hypothetical protein HK105_005584 [Polyrhizophydium stewartii]
MQRAMNQRRQAVPGRLGPLFGQQEVAGAATAAADLLESLTRFENASSSAERRAFRRAVRESQRDPAFSYLQIMRHMGADIEELMMMEAIRQSLQDSASAGAPSSGPAQPAAASADDSADLDVSHSSDEALISAAISAAVNSAIADHVQAAMPESPRASDGDRPRRDDEEDLTGAPGPSFVRSAAAVADQSSSLSLPRGPGSEPAAAISYDASTPIDARSATLVSAERESQAALAPSIAGVSLESPAPSFSRPLSFTSSSMPIPSDESPAAPEPARSPTTSFAAPSFSSNAPTFDTSSLRTDRYVHVILEHAEPAAPDGGSELTRTNDDSHDTLTQGVRIVAISTRNSEAARRNDADEVVSFDSLAARKSISGDLDSEPLPGSLSVRSHGVLAPAPSPTPSSDVASPVPDVALTAEEV